MSRLRQLLKKMDCDCGEGVEDGCYRCLALNELDRLPEPMESEALKSDLAFAESYERKLREGGTTMRESEIVAIRLSKEVRRLVVLCLIILGKE